MCCLLSVFCTGVDRLHRWVLLVKATQATLACPAGTCLGLGHQCGMEWGSTGRHAVAGSIALNSEGRSVPTLRSFFLVFLSSQRTELPCPEWPQSKMSISPEGRGHQSENL